MIIILYTIDSGDEDVIEAMRHFADITEQAKHTLENGEYDK